jgi:chorismate mutase
MRRIRTVPLPVAGLLLAGQLNLPIAAHAEPVSPLYELVDVAAQRLSTADPVAAYKWINGGPITDPQRADQVLDAVGADATAHGIDPQFVRTIFGDQIDATEGIEYTRFGQWKFDPVTAPTVAPDLSESRSAIDGFNNAMVDEVALQWNSLHGPGCAADLTSAKAAVVAAHQLDALYEHALSSATQSYCLLT